jgi:hypothetical protein
MRDLGAEADDGGRFEDEAMGMMGASERAPVRGRGAGKSEWMCGPAVSFEHAPVQVSSRPRRTRGVARRLGIWQHQAQVLKLLGRTLRVRCLNDVLAGLSAQRARETDARLIDRQAELLETLCLDLAEPRVEERSGSDRTEIASQKAAHVIRQADGVQLQLWVRQQLGIVEVGAGREYDLLHVARRHIVPTAC